MQIKKFFSEIRNTNYLYIIFIIGIALMLLTAPEKKTDTVQPEILSYSDEERLEKMLSCIHGIGHVEVMVTYFSSSEKDPAYESKIRHHTNAENRESDEEKTVVLSDGTPFILREIYPEVKGVVVIADGASNTQIKKSIQDAVTTAMNIAAHRVCILY